jgi:hypothetical protein
MPFKDKNKAREYQREYQRRRRSTSKGGLTGVPQTLKLATLDDLLAVLERITGEILNADYLDLGVRGRILAQLLTVGIKLVEQTDIERRIEVLEARAEQIKNA